MRVSVIKMGNNGRTVECGNGTTVGEAIGLAGFTFTEQHSITVGGLGADLNAPLSEGQNVVISANVKGGK